MTQHTKPESRPVVKLIGTDGNAFAVVSRCRQAAREAGWADEQWDVVREEMFDGDYDHLLGVVMNYFEVE